MPTPTPPDTDAATAEDTPALEELAARIQALETQLETLDTPDSRSPLSDPELAHKVLHACLDSDAISTEEELTLLHALLE